MQFLHAIYSYTFERMPYPVRLLLNLLVLPLVLTRALVTALRSTATTSKVNFLTIEELREQLQIPCDDTTPEADFINGHADKLAALFEASDWIGMDKMLIGMAQTRTPMGELAFTLVLHEFWKRKLDQMSIDPTDAISLENDKRLEKLVAPFDTALAARPKSWAMHCAAAWAHMQVGWLARGGAVADTTSKAAFVAMAAQFATAREILDGVANADRHSVHVLGAYFDCTAGLAKDAKTLIDSFSNWFAAEQTNVEACTQLGWFLLPRWHGSLDIIDHTARQLYAQTHANSGAAAYSMMFLNLLSIDAEDFGANPWQVLDAELFCQGLIDWIDLAGDKTLRLNRVCRWLQDWSCPAHGVFEDEATDIAAKRIVLRQNFEMLVRTRLTCVFLEPWQCAESEVFYAIGEVFEKEILAGEIVKLGEH